VGNKKIEKTGSFLGYGLFAMFITHTLTHVAGSIRTTLFPVIKEEFSLSNQQIGLIAAIPPLCTALIAIPAGLMSDRYGTKKLIALSIGMAAVGAFFAGITQNLLMFIAATTLLTLNAVFFHPPANSWTTKHTKVEDVPKALGIFGAGGTFGFALGPLSITILMGMFALSWRQSYLFWVVPILLGLLALHYVKSEPSENSLITALEDEPVQSTKLLSTSMTLFLLSNGIRWFGNGMTMAFLSIYLVESQGLSLAFIGLMFGASRLLGLIASPLGGVLAQRFGEKSLMVISLVASYTCFLLAFLVKAAVPFVALYLSHRFFSIICMPAHSSIIAKLTPQEKRGMGFAISFLPESIVQAISPIVAALIADTLGLYPIFMTSTLVFFIGLGVFQFGVKID